MRRKTPNVRSLKFIFAVRELNRIGVAPSADGLTKHLQGDPSTERFASLKTHGCLISLRPKAAKALIRCLVRDGTLKEIYSRVEGEQYLQAVDYAKAEEYFARHEIIKTLPAAKNPAPFIRIN